MSLPAPLAVRLVTPRADMDVTADVADVSLRSVMPGGYASATIALRRPLALAPDEIALYSRLVFYDTRSAATVWEGHLEDPGRTAGTGGQVWEIAAVGPSAIARDRTFPVIYVDRRIDADTWVKKQGSTDASQGTVSATEDPDSGVDAIMVVYPSSTDVVNSSRVTAQYRALIDTGQRLAYIQFSWDAGLTVANWVVRLTTYASQTVARAHNTSTGGGGNQPTYITSDWPNTDNRPDLALVWTGGASATGTSDAFWVSFKDVAVIGSRYDRSGNHLLTEADYPIPSHVVKGHQVVEDLLGRILSLYDGPNATIDTTTSVLIDQMAYPDGVTAAQVLDDVMALDPAYRWGAWDRDPATGKYQFEYIRWPTVVGLEADVLDGFSSPGSAADLYDRVVVRYRSPIGQIKTLVRTQTVPELAAAGRIRTAFLDLGDEVGSEANAILAGDAFLAEHAAPPNAGTLTVARPVMDQQNGRYLAPHELVRLAPGRLIRVRDVLPRPDALNATARDAVTIFRVVGVEYSSAEAAASLELDSYPVSTARQLGLYGRRLPPVQGRRRR